MLPGGGKAWHFEHSRLAKRSGASAPAGPAALRNPARHRAKPDSLRGGVSALGQVSQIIRRSRQLPTVQKQVKSLKTRSEIGILLRKKIVILL